MSQVTQTIIWWIGALLCISALGLLTRSVLVWLEEEVAKRALHITRLITIRYWVNRMEQEGLTICMKDYRQMIADRKPQDLEQFNAVASTWEDKQG